MNVSGLTVSTQFNDLRKGGQQTCLRDLIELALFGNQTLIRDSDVVNNGNLLKIANDPALGFQRLIQDQTFVFALRENKPKFLDVHDEIGTKRAYPEHYTELREEIQKFDILLDNLGVEKFPHNVNRDLFGMHIDRILTHPLVDPFAKDLLFRTVENARRGTDGPLKFGSLYSVLKEDLRDSPEEKKQSVEELLKICRTAHSLYFTAGYNIGPSTANNDIDPFHVALVLGYKSETKTSASSESIKFLPKISLREESFVKLTFDQIAKLRASNEGIEYRKAMTAAQTAWTETGEGASSEKAYALYLEALENYLISIQVDGKVEVENWQKSIAERAIANRRKRDELIRNICLIGVPIIVAIDYGLITQSILPLVLPALAGSMAKSVNDGILKDALNRNENERPYPLSRLLNGTTYTPIGK